MFNFFPHYFVSLIRSEFQESPEMRKHVSSTNGHRLALQYFNYKYYLCTE